MLSWQEEQSSLCAEREQYIREFRENQQRARELAAAMFETARQAVMLLEEARRFLAETQDRHEEQLLRPS